MKFLIRKRRQPGVAIVPLIDILLVLLIFLMVTATFQKPPSIRLTLPASTTGEPTDPPPDLIRVSIAREAPHLHVDGEAVTADGLRGVLERAMAGNPDVHLAIAADEGAPFGEVVRVLDLAKETGFRNRSVTAFTRTPGSGG